MKIINKILEFVGHFLIYLSCYFNLPSLCAYIIRISIRKKKFLPKRIRSKKVVIVLDREIGHRDMEIIQESSNKNSEFLFFRRSITKLILSYFCKKKIFFLITQNLLFMRKIILIKIKIIEKNTNNFGPI